MYEWFTSNGIYTSCHDLISRILQFDVDGDQLNVVTNSAIISAAKRTISKYDIHPLFYDAIKAKPEILTDDSMFFGLKRAYEYSAIGEISNNLTKLWNKAKPDVGAAACICKYNNYMIDGAKTGVVDSYENYPIGNRVKKAIGSSVMPWFFQFSKNGRTESGKKYQKTNSSVMNRICARFEKPFRTQFCFANIAPFNWKMLMAKSWFDNNQEPNKDAIRIFCEEDEKYVASNIASAYETEIKEKANAFGDNILIDDFLYKINGICDFGTAYYSVTQFLYENDGEQKTKYKQIYFKIFGEKILETLKSNLEQCEICPICKRQYPVWQTSHECKKKADTSFMIQCVDCGKTIYKNGRNQKRCPECAVKYRLEYKIKNDALRRAKKKNEDR